MEKKGKEKGRGGEAGRIVIGTRRLYSSLCRARVNKNNEKKEKEQRHVMAGAPSDDPFHEPRGTPYINWSTSSFSVHL